jgi:hypothetical protein
MHLPYVAGIIDGERCIGLSRTRTSVFPRLLVANTDLKLLKEFKKQFGGDIKKMTKRPGRKQGYTWRLSWSADVVLLDKVQKYLRVKDRQAAAAFAWDTIRPGRGTKRTKEYLDAVEYLVSHMHKLNDKGAK